MNTGAMFGILPSYGSYSFWQSYPVIHFDTRFEKGEYTVFAAFYSKIYDEKDTTHFKYYQWKDLSDENSFNNYIANVKSLSAYDTGITPVYGDSVITLLQLPHRKRKICCGCGQAKKRIIEYRAIFSKKEKSARSQFIICCALLSRADFLFSICSSITSSSRTDKTDPICLPSEIPIVFRSLPLIFNSFNEKQSF